MAKVTIQEGLTRLLQSSGVAYRDQGFALSLLEWVASRPLTARQSSAGQAMLARYGIEAEGSGGRGEAAQALALSQGVRLTVEDVREEGRIAARSPYKYKDLLKGVSGARWNGTLKAWTWPASLTCAANLETALALVTDPVSRDDEYQALLGQQATVEAAREKKTAVDLPDIPGSKTSAWMHQRQAYWFAKDMVGTYLGMEMGQQPFGAKVLTPRGWREFGTLEVGDEVIGSDGLPTRVEECKSWSQLPVWEVELEDGGTVKCSPNHLWTVRSRDTDFQTLPLTHVRASLDGPSHRRLDKLPTLAPVQGVGVELPLDPYTLGVLLGDGSFARCCAPSGRTAMRLAGEKNRERIEHLLPEGITMSTERDGKHHHFHGDAVQSLVHELGLCGARSATKFIPSEYLSASVDQRRDLLRGLMDTDGRRGRQTYYSTTSRQLALDVEALVRSLGGRGGVSIYRGGYEYRVRARLDGDRQMLRRIVAIHETGRTEPQRCIRVANEDGLYVTNDYVLTHNTGKSKVTVDLLTTTGARTALILCPVSVLRVWPREFRTHAGEHWNVLVLDAQSGKVAERATKAEEALKKAVITGQRQAIVINYEAASMKAFGDWALSKRWDYLVCDESHRVKAPNGQRSKFVAKLATRANRRLCLSGTPMPQTPLDIWAQFRILDPHIFGNSFHAFKNVYALWGGYEGREFLGMNPLKAAEFEERLSLAMYRATADVLDLPPDRDVERLCTLSKKAMKLYQGIKEELHGEIVDEKGNRRQVSMDNVLTKLLRMQQITGGAVNDDSGRSTEVDDSKAALLKDILEDVNEPAVVFCRFIHDLDKVKQVATELGRNYGELSGRQNDLNSDAKMPQWCDVMAVQIQAGGVGIDLTRAHYGIYYSVGYSLGDYLQSRARLVRPGQENEVLFMHLIAAGTIDEEVYKALAKKEKVVDFVLDGI